MIIKVVRETAVNGAIPSKVYVDGTFFSYGLESEVYRIPKGTYDVYLKKSPSLGSKKVYIDVPERSNIMIHGGNTANDSKGCILVGATRSGDTIAGDQSGFLYDVVEGAANNGEGVAVVVTDQKALYAALAAVCFLGFMFFFNSKKGR